ncbi:hypothetical protein [Streptomyces sp. NBC_00199]|nr:hypothetical protein [Streptomyces sp. NBC_00199]MCX5263097.1 hypothetical protein [Streptomyces sp. NBC_00199]
MRATIGAPKHRPPSDLPDAPSYLLPPVIVTQQNAAEAYAGDPEPSPLTK